MTGTRPADCAELAAERYFLFRRRPDVAPVIARWQKWHGVENGLAIVLQLTVSSAARARGSLSRIDYDALIRDLAECSRFPLGDFLIVAKCELEYARYLLACNGQIAFDPLGWDAEDDGA